MSSAEERRQWIAEALGYDFGRGATAAPQKRTTPIRSGGTRPGAPQERGTFPRKNRAPTPLSEAQAIWDAGLAEARKCSASHMAKVGRKFPAQAKGLQNVLDSYGHDLTAMLDSQHDRDEIGKLIQALRAEMTADRLFTHLESNGIPVRAALVDALDRVESVIRKGPAEEAEAP